MKMTTMTRFGKKKKKAGYGFDITKIDAEHFLEVMKVENLTSATEFEFMFSCPFAGHTHGDQSPSAYMNKETTAWMCHGCKRSGNAITFYEESENVSRQEARALLQRIYGGKSPDPDEFSVMMELERIWAKRDRDQETLEPNPALDESLIDDLVLDWRAAHEALEEGDEIPDEMVYMFDRGFDAETLAVWEIGWDEYRERITIPVFNEKQELVGFKGRAVRKEHKPKYLVMGGKKYDYPRFEKSQVVFGLERVVNRVGGFNDAADFILCEGELDVISMHSKGFDTAVCVAGSDLSEMQARLLRRHGHSVTIFFDSDEGGNLGTLKVIEAIQDFMPVRVVPDHEGDPAELSRMQIQQLLDESETAAKAIIMSRGE